jgi:hypothetical protein
MGKINNGDFKRFFKEAKTFLTPKKSWEFADYVFSSLQKISSSSIIYSRKKWPYNSINIDIFLRY